MLRVMEEKRGHRRITDRVLLSSDFLPSQVASITSYPRLGF
jgi:hypothetical protein